MAVLTFREVAIGSQEAHLNLKSLYPEETEYARFRRRLAEFLRADPAHGDIFRWEDHSLNYRTECLIPKKRDDRKPLLLLFGNPASHSVGSGMFFAYEGTEREHRLWKALRTAQLLTFPSDRGKTGASGEQLHSVARKHELYSLDYDSPFRIGLAVFFSIPSPASGTPWAGVAGVRRLFGQRALNEIAEVETARVCGLVRAFLGLSGAVVAFQKDAYDNLATRDSPAYQLSEARRGGLVGRSVCDERVALFGLPTTRMALAKQSLGLLSGLRAQLCSKGDVAGHGLDNQA